MIDAQKAELEKLGHTVCVFSTGYPRNKEQLAKLAQKHIFMVPSCRWWLRGVTPLSRRPRVIEKWLEKAHPELKEFDIFYIHYEAGCSIAGMRLARQLGIPVVQMMQGREDMGIATVIAPGFRTMVAGLLKWLHGVFVPHSVQVQRDDYLAQTQAAVWMWELMVNHANTADAIVTPSQHFKKKLEYYGVSKPIYVVPNGYPDEKYEPKVPVKQLKDGDTLQMIWHSRVQAEKRIMPFLKALTEVRGKWHMDVYGGGADLARARLFAIQHRLPVKFHGNTSFAVVQRAILKSHLDVMASYNYDTFGMTLIEAEACGVPVFICDPDMREIVPEGGYVLSAGPAAAMMAEALNDLLAHPGRIERMSEAMVAHRPEVLASRRIKGLVKVFQKYAKNS